MRILVCPHTLEIGGSQLNAVELAAAVRDAGDEVIIFGPPGQLQHRITELGLEFIAAPTPGRRPSPTVIAGLNRVVRDRRIDLVHGYEWTTALEAYLGPRLRLRVPVVATVMSMAVAPFLPRDLPLVVGTAQIGQYEKDQGRRYVAVIEPPVDLVHNRADLLSDREHLRKEFGLDPAEVAVVCVTRLAAELKLEGLLAAIEAVSRIAGQARLRLLLVGDGPAREQVEQRAAEANRRVGRTVVELTGELADPRPAYAVADIALGMGGSALRALAFGTALIVQGERGFWEVLTPQSQEAFLWSGWYGVGTDPAAGADRLAELLLSLALDPARRTELAQFGRQLVAERFDLVSAGERQADVYREVLAQSPESRGGRIRIRAEAAARFADYKARRLARRFSGTGRADDFNARPIAARGIERRSES